MDNCDAKTLGARLRKLRGKVAQAEIARRCGWEPTRQWKYESGMHKPDSDGLTKLARVFGTTVEALLAPVSALDDAPAAEDGVEEGPSSGDSGTHGLVDPDAKTTEIDAAAVRS